MQDCLVLPDRSLRDLQEEDKDSNRYSADGEVYVKAPAPAIVRGNSQWILCVTAEVHVDSPHVGRESPTHQGPCDRSNPEDCADEALEERPLLQRHDVDDDDDRAALDTGGAKASNGATEDEGGGIGRSATDGGCDFEEEDVCEVDPFGVVECVYAAEENLERASCQEVRAAIPALLWNVSSWSRCGGRIDLTISPKLWKSLLSCGMAVPMMVRSWK